jgi:transcriptional regulator with AAA-type ATPase domain
MNEEQKDNKGKKAGNHYSEFSLDEFNENSPYTVQRLCEAIKADNYGLKFHNSSDNSIDRLNELLENTGFPEKLIKEKPDIKWSTDTKYLIPLISENRKIFSKLNPDEQINLKRLNRLLLEEAYPKETPKSSKYFIPPELMDVVDLFEDHYKVADKEPILIIGPTGVGKSLFLHIFEKLYREEHQDEKKHPIIKANCAHFGGDPNMVRSELFGHKKGAYTGAISNKKGFVEMANNGILILEEIGDLPPDTQAALLTFIETGEYYCVGYDNSKSQNVAPPKANVQIIGLTNRVDNLREDLKYRFFPFELKPIYNHRSDILHYVYAMFPDLFDSITPHEIFTIMSYNWPGNIREIKRECRLMLRYREQKKRNSDSYTSYQVRNFNFKKSGNFKHIDFMYYRLPFDDRRFLDSIMNNYQIDLCETLYSGVVFNIDDSMITLRQKVSERYGLRFTYDMKSFEKAYEGLTTYCTLFYCFPEQSDDLAFLDRDGVFLHPDEDVKYPKGKKRNYLKLRKSIFEGFSGIQLPKRTLFPEGVNEIQHFIVELRKSYPDNTFLANSDYEKEEEEEEEEKKNKAFDISSFKVDDLLKLYYQSVLDRAQGVQSKGADIAGQPYQTFRDNLRRYEIEAGQKSKWG